MAIDTSALLAILKVEPASVPRHEEAVRVPEDPFSGEAQELLQGQRVNSACEPVHGSPSVAMQDLSEGIVCPLRAVITQEERGITGDGVKGGQLKPDPL